MFLKRSKGCWPAGRWAGLRVVMGGFIAAGLAGGLGETGAFGQTSGDGEVRSESSKPRPGDEVVETYLENLGLQELRADFLFERIQRSPREQRVALAERLARLYVQMLTGSTDPEKRRGIEQRADELLKLVPEADGTELRLNLSKAMYVSAEEMVERGRVRLVKIEDLKEAEATLRGLEPTFREIAGRVHQRVEMLEAREQGGQESEELAGMLTEARRLRSLAFYYAGWCNYYVALIAEQRRAASGPDASSVERPAIEAQKCFGWLLDSPNHRVPMVDRASAAKFKYEHVARSAIGCALAAGLRGNDIEAIRWLDAVERAPDLPGAVGEQLLSRRIIVLAGARRWADLERLIRQERKSDRAGGGRDVAPLSVINARLLAVETLRADRRAGADFIDGLGRIALGDLVARGEVAHVLDLVSQFGTTPIGETGFIVNYVRGVQAYERARAAHQADAQAAHGSNPEARDADEPAVGAKTINLYLTAADLLDGAIRESDAPSYPQDRARGAVLLGRARYFAGNMLAGADAFYLAYEQFGATSEGEEALWLTIIALEKAVEGEGAGLLGSDKATQQRRNQTITLFLQTFPASERAGRLLMMQISAGLISQDEAVRVLANVSKESGLYSAARRQLARLLYERLRASGGSAREVAAIKFLEIADEVLTIDRRLITDAAAGKEQAAAAQRVIVLARQMLDALLGVSSPDAGRAASILALIDAVAAHQQLDLGVHQPELLYRRVQIKLAGNDEPGAIADATALAEMVASIPRTKPGGADSTSDPLVFVDAADRLIYRKVSARVRAAEKEAVQQPGFAGVWIAHPEDARVVVQFGMRVLDRLDRNPKAIQDAAVQSAYSTVAHAAFSLWRSGAGDPMRDLCVKLDRRLLSVRPGTKDSLARLSEVLEAGADHAGAFEIWSTRLAGEKTGSDAWFEAKFNALRLLVLIDSDRALAQVNQHQGLYPDCGPEPWGWRIRQLLDEIKSRRAPAKPADPQTSTTPTSSTGPAAAPPGGGS